MRPLSCSMLVTLATCKRQVDRPWSPVQNVCSGMRLSCGPGRSAGSEAVTLHVTFGEDFRMS